MLFSFVPWRAPPAAGGCRAGSSAAAPQRRGCGCDAQRSWRFHAVSRTPRWLQRPTLTPTLGWLAACRRRPPPHSPLDATSEWEAVPSVLGLVAAAQSSERWGFPPCALRFARTASPSAWPSTRLARRLWQPQWRACSC